MNERDIPRGYFDRKPRKASKPRKPAKLPKGLFVTLERDGKEMCYCRDCKPENVNEGADDVYVWEHYSSGWLSAPICDGCKLSLPVYCDGTNESEAT